MLKRMLAALALFVGLGVAQPAPALAQDDWASGITLGAGVTCTQGSYDFRQGSGTPSIDIEGCLPALSAGYVIETESGWTFAFGADAAMSEFERCVRDGNAIVQCLSLTGIYSINLEAGYRWENGIGLFATVGYQQIMLEYVQSCGVGAAYTSAHCRNAGGPTGYRRTAEDTLEGWTVGVGAEFRISPRFTLRGDVNHQSEGAREQPYDGPDGNGNALGDIRPDDTGVTSVRIRLARSFGGN